MAIVTPDDHGVWPNIRETPVGAVAKKKKANKKLSKVSHQHSYG